MLEACLRHDTPSSRRAEGTHKQSAPGYVRVERAGIRFVAGVPRNIVDSRAGRCTDVCTRAMRGRIVLAIAICSSCGEFA